MPNIDAISSISLSINTRKRLASIGRKNQSYDNLVNEILEHVDICDRWCENR